MEESDTVPVQSRENGRRRAYAELAARIRVPAGIGLALVFVVFAQPAPRRLLWGATIALAGLLLRAASAGHLKKNRELATGGPYAYTRNPLYAGSALAGVGFCVAGGRWWFFLLLGLFLGAVYWPVIRREERHLSRLFPEDFAAYARSVPLLLPRLRRWRNGPANSARFDGKLYWSNREYEALSAYLAILLFLIAKMVSWR